MIAGSADIKRLNVDEAKPIDIEPVDKRVDSPHRIVLSHVLVKTRRKQRHLLAINHPLHKARHRSPAATHSPATVASDIRIFTQRLGTTDSCTATKLSVQGPTG
jgi:hypothetical protein